jgi:putative ABC transport system permease protein
MNSLINLVGFSIGIAACLFVFLFMVYEHNFDNFYPNQERLYRLVGISKTTDQQSVSAFQWMPVVADMKADMAGIENFCRVTEVTPAKVYLEDKSYQVRNMRYADENFFSFFNFKLLVGNTATALNEADKIVLTEKEAQRLFGTIDVVGRNLTYQHQLLTVSAIAANPPSNTHLTFDAIISNHNIEQNKDIWKNWGGGITFLSYLELAPGISAKQLEQSFPDFFNRKINNNWAESGWHFSAYLQRIEDVHLSDGSITNDSYSTRSRSGIYVVGSVSLLILLLAMVNYIILYTSQKLVAQKDIAILRIHGAQKRIVFLQTYLEVIIVAFFSTALSVLLLQLALPFLNDQLNTQVSIFAQPALVFCFLSVVLFVVSAFVTFFSTRKLLFTHFIDLAKDGLRIRYPKVPEGKLLLSFQFVVVIVLLICVITIVRQNRLLQNKELGFEKENILVVEAEEEFLNNELDGFKQDLLQLAGVKYVSLSSQTVGAGLTMNGYQIEGEEVRTMLKVLYTDADFLKCFDVQLISGRNFSPNPTRDRNAVLINEKLAQRAGWKQPLDKTLNRNGDLHVVGVVDDFNFESLQNQIRPMLIMVNPAWDGWGYSTVNIRFQTTDIQNLISQVEHLWKDRFSGTPFQVSFLDDRLASNYRSFQAQQKLIGFFSFLAIIISAIGLFGVTVFATRLKTKEIGIRKVNGAKILEVMILLNKDFIRWVIIAFVIAIPIAWYAMHRWLENFAYKTELSWWIFALAGLLALGIALLTVSWQSWKAATKNPVEALRYE